MDHEQNYIQPHMRPEVSENCEPQALNSGKHIRERAYQACHRCRRRKTKCVLPRSGPPCHACRVAGIDCVTSEPLKNASRRSRSTDLAYDTSPLSIQVQTRRSARKRANTPRDGLNQTTDDLSSQPASSVIDASGDFLPVPIQYRKGHPTVIPSTDNSQVSSFNLPSYIHPPQRRFKEYEIDCLIRGGALSLPATELRDALFYAFSHYVFPFLPVIDFSDFLTVLNGDSSIRVSLLLFQAVMFAGSAFVDLQHLLKAGYADRMTARVHLHKKVKLLYDVDWECDRVTLIQTILLHSHWHLHQDYHKDPWHWLGICIDLATSIGLNQKVTYINKDAKTVRLWRRLWWTCILRDRVIAISMRKPMRIRDEEFNLAPIQFSDFNTRTLMTSNIFLRDSPLMLEGSVKTMLVDMFMSTLNLFLIIGHVMERLYIPQVFPGSTSDFKVLYFPKKGGSNDEEVNLLLEELSIWEQNLNAYCFVNYKDGDIDVTTRAVLRLHRAQLRMSYLMGQAAVYSPHIAMSLPQTEHHELEESLKRERQVTSDMCKLIQSLHEQKLIRFLPPITIFCLFSTIRSLLFEIKSAGTSPSERRQMGDDFHHCVRSLLALREIWPIANGACVAVGQLIRSRHIGREHRTLRMMSASTASNETSNSDDEVMDVAPELETLVHENAIDVNLSANPAIFPTLHYESQIHDFNTENPVQLPWNWYTSWEMTGFGLRDLDAPMTFDHHSAAA